jgi:Flp pilus assembly pilin Flp
MATSQQHWSFWADDSGATTVDFVVMAAAIVGLGIGTVSAVSRGVTVVGTGVEDSLACATVSNVLSNGAPSNVIIREGPLGLTDAQSADRARVYRTMTTEAILYWHAARVVEYLHLVQEGIHGNPEYAVETPWRNLGAGQTLDLLRLQVNELQSRGVYPVPDVPRIGTLQSQYEARFSC